MSAWRCRSCRHGGRWIVHGDPSEPVALAESQVAEAGLTNARRFGKYCIEDWLQFAWRAANDS